MKEIKFRAWDGNEMQKVKGYDWEECGCNSENLEDICKTNYSGYIDLMQYTGIKDKNGVEIYEGDILQYYQDGKLRGFTKTVEDIRETFMTNSAANDAHDYGDYIQAEIIGNIHQNPELLT